MDKTHVQHTVGFIEYQYFKVVELHRILAVQVHQTTRGSHENIHATAQLLHLWINFNPTKNHGGGHIEVLAVNSNTLANLCCQLASRR